MALQTITRAVQEISAQQFLKTAFSSVGFPFDEISETFFGKYINQEKTEYIGFDTSNGTPRFLLHTAENDIEDAEFVLPVLSTGGVMSAVWNEDLLTIFIASDSGFPSEITKGWSQIGIFFAKCEDENGEETWCAGYVPLGELNTDTGYNGKWWRGFVFSADRHAFFSASNNKTTLATNLLTKKMITTPCIGKNTLCPEKLSLITGTPETMAASVGWVTVGGREYYQNGIFLIDAQREG